MARDYSKKSDKAAPRVPAVHDGDGGHRSNNFYPQMAHQLEVQQLGNTARTSNGKCPTCGK